MEQNEKIEKPAWVESVETLPEVVRQQVGTTCAGCISTLVQIGLILPGLFSAVCSEASIILGEHLSKDDVE